MPRVPPPRTPTGRPPANRGRRYPPSVLTAEEVGALMRAASPTSSTGLRTRALVAILYRAGLRITEALTLTPADLDTAGAQLRVHGKGDRWRVVGLDLGAVAIIERWTDRRAELDIPRGAPLICTIQGPTRGGRVGAAHVRRQIAALARRAGIERRVHPHGLRHTMAHELAMEGHPMPIIRDQLGHRSLDTTYTYLRAIAPADVVRTMKGRTWIPT